MRVSTSRKNRENQEPLHGGNKSGLGLEQFVEGQKESGLRTHRIPNDPGFISHGDFTTFWNLPDGKPSPSPRSQ